MRSLLLLVLLVGIPSQVMSRDHWQLSCKEFESLTRNLSKSQMDSKFKYEVLVELIRATNPECFE